MAAVVFIHGLLSSPQSNNAKAICDWLKVERPDIAFYCPALTPYPAQTIKYLDQLISSLFPQELFLVGSSMGGFWATYLSEKFNLKCALLNPVTNPVKLMPEYLGMDLENVHTGEKYRFKEYYIPQMKELEVTTIKNINNYFLLVNSGDEVLDYRDAVRKYDGCKQLILPGGEHMFDGLGRWVPDIVEFFEQ